MQHSDLTDKTLRSRRYEENCPTILNCDNALPERALLYGLFLATEQCEFTT